MLSRAITAVVCAALLLYAPVAEAAATTPMLGYMTAGGAATINGAKTPAGTTLYSGDRVATVTEAVAELQLNGGNKVLLPKASAVVLRNEAAQVIVGLEHGSIAVLSKGAAPAFVDAGGVRIKPAAIGANVVEIAVAGGSLKVLVRRGSAVVEAANKTLEVPEGKELDAAAAPAPDPPSPQGGAGPIATARSSLLTWEVIGALGAGLTGLGLGVAAITRANPANCTVVSASTITCP